jgi:hypothetical protein
MRLLQLLCFDPNQRRTRATTHWDLSHRPRFNDSTKLSDRAPPHASIAANAAFWNIDSPQQAIT